MSRFLMTHSLLSSWLYAIKDDPFEDSTSEKDPMAEFMLVLRREPTVRTEAMQRGIDFEDLVTAIINNEKFFGVCETISAEKDGIDRALEPAPVTDHYWYNAAASIASIVGGGVLQYKARKVIQVSDLSIILNGRLDALKAGGIYDIKFTSHYERGKYFNSTQHPVYLELVPTATHFTYLVSNGTDVWTEQYRRDETQSVYPIISDFLEWLNAYGLMDVYLEKWEAR